MRLLLARHLWGVDLSAGLAAASVGWREVGYEAIEASIRHTPDPAALRTWLKREGWALITDVYTDDFRLKGSVEAHLASLREQVAECAEAEPLFINAHSGLDRWSLAEMEDFFGGALEIEREAGVPIAHETHRRRCLATPWAAQAVLACHPTLKLTADLSHWVCVTERLLEDFADLIAQVARQTWHVHARVGCEHGPQVPDPRAPEWARQVAAHEAWWALIWASQRERGLRVSTLTPEYGPPPYLWTWPHTQAPAADLAAVCDAMAARLRGKFG